jgi:outer membrane protein TolC
MRRLRTIVVLMATATMSVAPYCWGDELLGDPLTLETLIAYARTHNPEIRSADSHWRAALARPAQAGALPDPMADIGYHNEGFNGFPLGSSDFTFLRFGASQEVPFPGKLGLRRDIASRSADEAAESLRRVELDVVSRVKIAYAEYAHLQELLHLLDRNKTLLEQFAHTAESKYAVGEGIQQDVLKAQVESSLLLDRETTLDQRRQSETAQLNALLDRAPWEPLGTAEHPTVKSLTLSQDQLTDAAHAHAPDLKMAEFRLAGGEAAVALAHREYLPDFVLRAEYMQKAALLPEWEVGLGIKLPLYFATKQRNGVAEAAAMLSEARSMRDTALRSLDFRVKDLFLRARASERLIALYHTTVIPQARLALESATQAYAVGKVDFLTLLNSFTVMLEYEMRYHEELANFQKAIAELEATIGESLSEVVL